MMRKIGLPAVILVAALLVLEGRLVWVIPACAATAGAMAIGAQLPGLRGTPVLIALSLIAALVPNVAVSILGFLVAGLGTSVLFPQLYDRAARSAGPPGSGFASMLIGQRGADRQVVSHQRVRVVLSGRRQGEHTEADDHQQAGACPEQEGQRLAARLLEALPDHAEED